MKFSSPLLLCLALAPQLSALEVPPTWPIELNGFWEMRGGTRIHETSLESPSSLGEGRLELDAAWEGDSLNAQLKIDFLADQRADSNTLDLERGEGWMDLREANLFYRLGDTIDLKLGRQVLTWGTGDLLFINDLFPKDWVSFSSGRRDEYLKAPSDAIKSSWFSDVVNVNLVYTPAFDADRSIEGQRLVYWHPMLGAVVGENSPLNVKRLHRVFDHDEWAMRLYRHIQDWEASLYAYDGYWKTPSGFDLSSGQALYHRLRVYGGSLRGPFKGGIGNTEWGYYDSLNDQSGKDPLVRNGEFRFLLGYERELFTDFTASVQAYTEWMQDYNAYRSTLFAGTKAADEWRQVFTLRLRKLALQQNLTLGLMALYSPTDNDAHLRPQVEYRYDDRWTFDAGAVIFLGDEPSTFYGQFVNNSSCYLGARMGF